MKRLSLFWRMYLGFLLALLLPVGLFELSALGARQRFHGEMVRGLPRLLVWTVSTLAEEAGRVRSQGGEEALAAFLRREGELRGMELYVTDPKGTFLSAPPSDPLRPEGPESPPGSSGERVLRFSGHRLGVSVPLPDAPLRLLGILLPPEGRPPGPPGPPPPGFRNPLRGLLLPMVAGATLCFLLVRWLTVPLRDLRRATSTLAGGDLAARVGPKVTDRGDEIAELGRAFNAMAERIQSLVTSQRRLLGDISHELRSPLQRVGLAAALARKDCTPEGEAYLDRIEEETGRMGEMIGQLLDLTREELRDLCPEEEPVYLEALLERIAADGAFEGAEEGKRVELSVPEAVVVWGEAEPLARALENGVRNALRHTPPGTGVEVKVLPEGDRVRILVRDHGPGVEEGELERIFLPFYRVDSSRDRRQGGVGLGLAIAREGTRRLGGTVTARNHPQGGLMLEYVLPLRPVPAERGAGGPRAS